MKLKKTTKLNFSKFKNKFKSISSIEQCLNNIVLVITILASLSIIVYINSFFAPFTLDDFSSITDNYAIRNPLDFSSIWNFYSNRFILYYTISLNYFFNGSYVFVYHIVNLIIHIINGVLVYLILNNLIYLEYFSNNEVAKIKNIISLLAASIFICHPIQVNAVTYIIQRTASLAAMFYLLSVYFYILYRTKDKIKYFVFVFLFILLAMFTKENTITIPFMLIFIEFIFFLKEYRITWWKRLIIILVLLITVPIIPATNLVFKGHSQSDPNVSFKASTSMNRLHYFYTQMNVVIDYIKKTIIPCNLNFDYSNDYPISKTIWENNAYISLGILLVIGIFSLIILRKNKLISFGIIWFFIGLSVESSLISIKDVYFEHRLYFPIAGYSYFLAGLAFIYKDTKNANINVHQGSPNNENNNDNIVDEELCHNTMTPTLSKSLYLFLVIQIAMVIAYSSVTLYRNYIFSDSIRLWKDVVKKAPGSDRAHSILATNYLNEYEDNMEQLGYLKLAESEFLKAIELNYYNSTAHCNLSKVYLLKGEYEKSIEEGKKANRISSSKYAYNNIGNAYLKLGDINRAIEAFLEGYKIDEKSTFILKSLGDAYYSINDFANAKLYYNKYIENCNYCVEDEIHNRMDIINKIRDTP